MSITITNSGILSDRNEEIEKILEKTVGFFFTEMSNFLSSFKENTIPEEHLICLLIRATVHISSEIYFTIKKFLPTFTDDYYITTDFILDLLKNKFMEIQEKNLIRLTDGQIKEILVNGFTVIGNNKITMDDLEFKKEQIDSYLEKIKN